MATRFVSVDRSTPLLLPPDLRDWVPADHLAHFVIDAVEAIDLREVRVNTRGTGDEQYPPTLLLSLLVYSYATGTFGSRRIEQTTYDNVAVRLITGDTHPDHDTICTFRAQNKALVKESFVKVLQLAQELKLAKFGQMTVSVDGTKIAANASKPAAVSSQRAGEQIAQLELEVDQPADRNDPRRHRDRHDGVRPVGQDPTSSQGRRSGKEAGTHRAGARRRHRRGDAASTAVLHGQSALQASPADRRTRVRDHQVGARFQAVPSARHAQGVHGMDLGVPRLQPPTVPSPWRRSKTRPRGVKPPGQTVS